MQAIQLKLRVHSRCYSDICHLQLFGKDSNHVSFDTTITITSWPWSTAYPIRTVEPNGRIRPKRKCEGEFSGQFYFYSTEIHNPTCLYDIWIVNTTSFYCWIVSFFRKNFPESRPTVLFLNGFFERDEIQGWMTPTCLVQNFIILNHTLQSCNCLNKQ